MSWFMCDIESDGPIPGDYSMVSFGLVMIKKEDMDTNFYGQLKPISEKWIPEALNVSGHSREEVMEFEDPKSVMEKCAKWIKENNSGGRPMFMSDNNGFDWQFMNWYFHHFTGSNPFGFSSTNLGSLYKGMKKDFFTSFKHLRKTKHTHHPVDDCKGNVEALMHMVDEMNLKMRL